MYRIDNNLAHGPTNVDWSKVHILMHQSNWPTREEKRAFGSDAHGIPRARYTKEVNQDVMNFFKHLKENWTFVNFQEKHAKLSNDEYTDKLTDAMHWCVRSYKDGEWEIVGNNFIFKNDYDAASFIFRFID
jgi:hypothetical protein